MPNVEPVTRPSRAHRKVREGIVTSNRMRKTIVVQVNQLVRHPKYSRVVRKAASFKAHDETNEASIGDWVQIMETRPISKEKRWRLVKVLRRASSAPPIPGVEPEQAPTPATKTAQPVSG